MMTITLYISCGGLGLDGLGFLGCCRLHGGLLSWSVALGFVGGLHCLHGGCWLGNLGLLCGLVSETFGFLTAAALAIFFGDLASVTKFKSQIPNIFDNL